jgi:hypothetical protein
LKNPLNHPLLCHPSQACTSVSGISISASFREDGALHLRYQITGNPLFPVPKAPAAADNLWQHTCCELFVASAGEASYREFNFSPSGQWAAYCFTAYRQPVQDFQSPFPPQTCIRRHTDGFELDAILARELLPAGNVLEIGLTAVIEAHDGSKTYWALAHCAQQTDFHLRSSFSLTLHRP